MNMLCGIDVGSTTCKYVLSSGGQILAQAYERTTPNKPRRYCSSSRISSEIQSHSRPRSGVLHWLRCGRDRALRWRQNGAGSGGCGSRGGDLLSQRQLRQRNRRRRHEDDLFHWRRRPQRQAGHDASGLLWRHRHVHREDRTQAADRRRSTWRRWAMTATRCTESAASAASSLKPIRTRCSRPG